VEVCSFLNFNHAIPYMLEWMHWKTPSPCSVSLLLFVHITHTHFWGGYSLPFDSIFHVISLTIDQHVSSKLHLVAPWFQILLYFGMIHNMKKRISNVHWWFIISNACMLSNIMYCIKNTSNVVNTRTNICYIHGCHIRTNHKKNVATHAFQIMEWFH